MTHPREHCHDSAQLAHQSGRKIPSQGGPRQTGAADVYRIRGAFREEIVLLNNMLKDNTPHIQLQFVAPVCNSFLELISRPDEAQPVWNGEGKTAGTTGEGAGSIERTVRSPYAKEAVREGWKVIYQNHFPGQPKTRKHQAFSLHVVCALADGFFCVRTSP